MSDQANQTNQHYHAALIHAWADGAKIQYFSKKRDKWVTVNTPTWDADKQYRLKRVLKDWQKELVEAVKDGHEVEYNFMGNWVPAHLNDIADNKDDVLAYGWESQDKYRIKPAELPPSIKLEGMLLIGTRQDENGKDTPYLKAVPLDLSVAAGDSINFKYSFGE